VTFECVELYEDPDVFRPERFMESAYGTKPGADTYGLRATIFFGAGNVCDPKCNYGRYGLIQVTQRMCPGIPTAIALTVRH
jgi:cytochrome P450